MNEVKPDHNWLMRYDILRQVNQCRRLIQAEFGEKPLLDDPQLRNRLADYAGHSRSQALQRCYAEMRLLLIELEGQDLMPPPIEREDLPVRMYRGRPVLVDTPQAKTPGPSGAAELTTAPVTSGKTITYRGRTMQVA